MINQPFASIVICAHGGLEETTIPCIDNLLTVTHYPYQLICVDDGSKDSGATIRYFRTVADIAIRLTRNLGVAVARNHGIQAASGDPVIFLDNDAFPPNDWLNALVRGFLTDDIGIVGGIPSNEIDRTGRLPASDGLIPFDHVSGCCMAVSRHCIEVVGLFDERLWNQGEDTDLCYRAMDRGFRVVAVPGLIVEHRPNTTRRNLDKARMNKAAQRFIEKYQGDARPMPLTTPWGS